MFIKNSDRFILFPGKFITKSYPIIKGSENKIYGLLIRGLKLQDQFIVFIFAQALFAGSSGKERFLDELVKKEILYQEAVKKGFDKDPQFKAKVEDFKKITLVGLLLEKVIEEKSRVTPEDVKDYYDKNKDEVSPATQMRVSQIIVQTSDEAKGIYEKLQKGEDFAKIAKQSSLDPGSAKNGGDLGYLAKGQMKPEIESVAVKLKAGQFSPPVKIPTGYLIVKVTEKKPKTVRTFADVRNQLSSELQQQNSNKTYEAAVAGLKALTAETALVVRDGERVVLDATALVPGDVLVIEEGDSVPADARVIESVSMKAAEAALTGESAPVDKYPAPLPADTGLADRANMLHAGTSVSYGHGLAIVTATGMRTEIGRIAAMIAAAPQEATPLQRELDRTGRVLGIVVVAIAVVVALTLVGMYRDFSTAALTTCVRGGGQGSA